MDSTTLFSTVAQVSFTITGLLLVAVASDKEIREYWFQNPAHKFFVNLNFISLFAPGLAALFALIPPIYEGWTPVWPISFFLFSVINFIFAGASVYRKYQKKENNEFRKICKHYWNIHRDLFIDATLYFFAALLGFSFHYSNNPKLPNPYLLAGIVLCVSIFTGAYNVLALFKPHPEDEIPQTKQPQSDVGLSEQPHDKKTNNSFQPLVIALYALIVFPLFMLLNRDRKKQNKYKG